MAHVKFKRLTEDTELEEFIAATKREIGITYPLEYFQRSRVYAMLDYHQRIVGGFVVVMKGPFFEIESIPVESRPKDFYQCKRVGEVTGLWLKRSYRIKHSLKFWWTFFTRLLLTGKTRFVYGYALKDHLLKRMYAKASPKVLYRGVTKAVSSEDAQVEESVEIITAVNLFLIPFKNPGFFLKRFCRKYYNKKDNPKNK